MEKRTNFSALEIHVLLSILEDYKTILENKTTNAVTNNEKQMAWEEITERFNSVDGVTLRSAKQLLNWYKNMKRKAAKNRADRRVDAFQIDEGSLEPGCSKDTDLLLKEHLLSNGVRASIPNKSGSDHSYPQNTGMAPNREIVTIIIPSTSKNKDKNCLRSDADDPNDSDETDHSAEVLKMPVVTQKSFLHKRKCMDKESASLKAADALINYQQYKKHIATQEHEYRVQEHELKMKKLNLEIEVAKKQMKVLDKIHKQLESGSINICIPKI